MHSKTIANSTTPQLELGRNTGHVIIHPECDSNHLAQSATEQIVNQNNGNNLLIPYYLDTQQPALADTALGITISPDAILRKTAHPQGINAFQNKYSEIVLSGGFFEICLLGYFKQILYSRLIAQQSIVFHFVMPAIFPRRTTVDTINPIQNNYFQLLDNPYTFFIGKIRDFFIKNNLLLENAAVLQAKETAFAETYWPQTGGIPSSIFLDGHTLWSNSNEPQVILNYWTART